VTKSRFNLGISYKKMSLDNYDLLLIVAIILLTTLLIFTEPLSSQNKVDPYINTSINASDNTKVGVLPNLLNTSSSNIRVSDFNNAGGTDGPVSKIDVNRGDTTNFSARMDRVESDTILNYPADPMSKMDVRDYPTSDPLPVRSVRSQNYPTKYRSGLPMFDRSYERPLQVVHQFDDKVIKRLQAVEKENGELKKDVSFLNNIVSKMYKTDGFGDYVVHGWFVQFHNVMSEGPDGVVLSEIIRKVHGVPKICFRARDGLPFLGTPEKPMLFPKADRIGFKATTILKIPKTGYYDFKVLSDDGVRVYYQKVAFDTILNEKNVRSVWNLAIDSWIEQAETWLYSKKDYFNENDLVMIRMDYYELDGFASACIRMRYHSIPDDKTNPEGREFDIPYKNTYCSLLWNEVPLLGYP
ncbi:hypothetical protein YASMINEVIRUS_1410, partial [Yasminevirus sp. GU-2018]